MNKKSKTEEGNSGDEARLQEQHHDKRESPGEQNRDQGLSSKLQIGRTKALTATPVSAPGHFPNCCIYEFD